MKRTFLVPASVVRALRRPEVSAEEVVTLLGTYSRFQERRTRRQRDTWSHRDASEAVTSPARGKLLWFPLPGPLG